MGGRKTLRQGNGIAIIALIQSRGVLSGVMRCQMGEIHQIGSIISRFSTLAHIVQRAVGQHLRRVFPFRLGGFKGTLKGFQGRIIVKRILLVLAGRIVVINGRVPVPVTRFIPTILLETVDLSPG